MSLFPTSASTVLTTSDLETNENIIKDRGINFLFDFNTKDFVLQDGKFLGLTGDAGVVFWIEKTIRTEYERAQVYKNTEYGFGIERFIGVALPPSIIKLQFEDNLKKSIYQHERIKSINNFTLSKVADSSEVEISMIIELNPITETDTQFGPVDNESFIRLDTLEEIQEFVGIKLLTSEMFMFKTKLGEQIYVKM